MKKFNKKGFILAEAIVASVFVLGIFTLVLINFLPSASKYSVNLTYDNPEDVYKYYLLKDTLDTSITNGYYTLKNDKLKDSSNNLFSDVDFINELVSRNFLNIEEILICKGSDCLGDSFTLNRGMSAYVSRENPSGDTKYIFVKFGNNSYVGGELGA